MIEFLKPVQLSHLKNLNPTKKYSPSSKSSDYKAKTNTNKDNGPSSPKADLESYKSPSYVSKIYQHLSSSNPPPLLINNSYANVTKSVPNLKSQDNAEYCNYFNPLLTQISPIIIFRSNPNMTMRYFLTILLTCLWICMLRKIRSRFRFIISYNFWYRLSMDWFFYIKRAFYTLTSNLEICLFIDLFEWNFQTLVRHLSSKRIIWKHINMLIQSHIVLLRYFLQLCNWLKA